MVAVDTWILLREAAAASYARIARDHRKAPEPLRPLVSFIGENLFNPELQVSYLQTRVEGADDRMLGFFGSAVGSPPFRYIEDRRMETACELLTRTVLRIWKIAEMLGYSSTQVFSRAFARCYGVRPTIYRKRRPRPRPAERFSLPRLATSSGLAEEELLERFSLGELDPHQARALLDRLRELYPEAG